MTDKLRVDRCPCGAEFAVEVHDRRMLRRVVYGVTSETDTSDWTVTCTAGHTYEVDCRTNVSPRWVLLPERRTGGAT